SAGLTINRAVDAVGRWGSGPLAAELARISAEVGAGRRLADCLDELPALVGDDVRPLTAGLAACERDGAPLADTLARLAVQARGCKPAAIGRGHPPPPGETHLPPCALHPARLRAAYRGASRRRRPRGAAPVTVDSARRVRRTMKTTRNRWRALWGWLKTPCPP